MIVKLFSCFVLGPISLHRQVRKGRKLYNFSCNQPPTLMLFDGARSFIEKSLSIVNVLKNIRWIFFCENKVSSDGKHREKLLMELEKFAILYVHFSIQRNLSTYLFTFSIYIPNPKLIKIYRWTSSFVLLLYRT